MVSLNIFLWEILEGSFLGLHVQVVLFKVASRQQILLMFSKTENRFEVFMVNDKGLATSSWPVS